MDDILALDTESNTWNKAAPFDSRGKLVCYSVATDTHCDAYQWTELAPEDVQNRVDRHKLIVGFNFKHDYHWLHNHGVDLSNANIWDVQLAEYILSHFTNKFPSLDKTCEQYNVTKKIDIVKTDYWEKGIQTEDIPWHILREYAAHDAKITLECYHHQRKRMTPQQVKLCQLMSLDMHVLREMEYNGIIYNEELCVTRSEEIDAKIKTIESKLAAIYPNVPINFASNDHLSAFLYGGTVVEPAKEMIGFYKTGDKKGQPKYKNIEIEHVLPQLYKPLKGSELLKPGMYSTDEATLKKLKGKNTIVQLLLELAKLEKLNGTYYRGLVKLRETMHWEPNTLHGSFQQASTATNRLSSSRPNLQNFSGELQDIFVSRYEY